VTSPPSLPLRTSRLLLRAYTPGDVEPIFAYYSDAEVSRFLLSEPFTLQDAEQTVETPGADPSPPSLVARWPWWWSIRGNLSVT